MHGIAVKSGTVRDKFSETIDEVIHDRPKVVKRRRDHFMMMNLKHFAAVVDDLKLNAIIEKDENEEYIASLIEIEDMFATGDTPDKALLSLADDLIEYAHEYLGDSFRLYFNAPNRKDHFRYVLKVMLADTPKDVVRLINAEPQRA